MGVIPAKFLRTLFAFQIIVIVAIVESGLCFCTRLLLCVMSTVRCQPFVFVDFLHKRSGPLSVSCYIERLGVSSLCLETTSFKVYQSSSLLSFYNEHLLFFLLKRTSKIF